MKLSTGKARVKWMRENDIFTTRTLWDAVMEVELNPCEAYWDYRDYFSQEQLEKVEDGGFKGEDELLEELYDNSWSYGEDMKSEQLKEIINGLTVDSFKEGALEKIQEKFLNDDYDWSPEEILDEIKEDFEHHIDDEDFIDDIKDFQVWDLNSEMLFRNTKYERVPWITLDKDEFQELIQDEITAFEEKHGYENLVLHPDVYETFYFKMDEHIPDTLEELAQRSEDVNSKFSAFELQIRMCDIQLYNPGLENSDELIIRDIIEKNTSISTSAYDIEYADVDEYMDGEWQDVFSMSINVPSDEHKQLLSELLATRVELGSSDEEAEIICSVDNYIIIESEFVEDFSYKTFGFNVDSCEWMERKITIREIADAKACRNKNSFEGEVITIDGYITKKSINSIAA